MMRAVIRWPELWLLLVCSVADIVLTFVLIGSHGHVEANPVARYFVYGWGLKGMIWFKAGLVSVIVAAAHLIARERPRLARRILQFALGATSGVVIWSVLLLLRSGQRF